MHRRLGEFCRAVKGPDASIVEQRLEAFDGLVKPALHPYGFYIWKLGGSDSGYSLRLHVWLPHTRPRQKPDWPPHSHNANLFSLLLMGEVENHEWNWRTDPGGGQVLYEVGYQCDQSVLRKTGEYGATTDLTISKFHQGQSYCVPSGQIHASEVARERATVTLVLLSEDAIGSSMVVGSRDGHSSYTFDRNAVAPDQHIQARQIALEGRGNVLR